MAQQQANGNATQPSREELMARIAQLEKQQTASLRLKVSEKGGVSLYGVGRWPVTLYYEQWKKLLSVANHISEFLEEHKDELSMKE